VGTSGVPVVPPMVERGAGSGALMRAMCGGRPVMKDRKDVSSLYCTSKGTDEILVGPPPPGDRPEPSRHRCRCSGG